MEDLLTVKQVAILLKVHPLTIRRYINEGKLTALRVAGNVRISHQELQNFSQTYSPKEKQSKPQTVISTSEPFTPNDSLFRLKARGLSLR
jgi:excisionase family DNA binding protein